MSVEKRLGFVPAITVPEGAGVKVKRTIGTQTLRNYDPFLLLDNFSTDNPDDYIAGFPSHPHRGFSTFTYMLDGYMQHKDSMGNTGNLEPGSAQLMKAASGVIHSEMPKQKDGLMRGFQLWINLPAVHKMDHPEYLEYAASDFPIVERAGTIVKALIGQYANAVSPIQDDIAELIYLDVQVAAGKEFELTLPAGHNSFIYLFEGDGKVNEQDVSASTLVTLGGVDKLSWTSGEKLARFLFVSGKPINEPIVQYGPFVMNTKEEIDIAIQDFNTNNFVRNRAWMNRQEKTVN
jgi:redox-sensitive bicupin YhaK (pirin superfamily)